MTTSHRKRVTAALLAGLVLVAPLTACGDGAGARAGRVRVSGTTPGPIARGYVGSAYPVPTGTDPSHPNAVPVTLKDENDQVVGSDSVPSGTPVPVRSVSGHPDQVRIRWRGGRTAVGPRSAFWSMPDFVRLTDMPVTISGVSQPLVLSGIRYHRGSVATFSDSKGAFDGVLAINRMFLACTSDTWGMGGQTFAMDLLEDGLHRHDRVLTDEGIRAIDWGVAVPIDSKGIHELHRNCDGKTVADFGYTHHATQWLESLGRAVYLLAASPWAGEYRATIDRYRRRVDTIATILAKPSVRAYWVSKVRDSFGNDFTHRTFMRAAAFGLASTLTQHPRDVARWAADAKAIAERGIHNQLPSGVNPERGGFDVQYQMYGTWLAQLYDATLPASSPMKHRMDRGIDRAVRWMTTRIDRKTGQIKIRGTTRICVEQLWTSGQPAPYVDPGETIRGFLYWGLLTSTPRLVDLAMLVDRGNKLYGNRCPRDYHARPEQSH